MKIHIRIQIKNFNSNLNLNANLNTNTDTNINSNTNTNPCNHVITCPPPINLTTYFPTRRGYPFQGQKLNSFLKENHITKSV